MKGTSGSGGDVGTVKDRCRPTAVTKQGVAWDDRGAWNGNVEENAKLALRTVSGCEEGIRGGQRR